MGTILGLPSVPRSLSPILLSPFEFPPSSQRTWGGTGNKEGEVSDPPYFVPRTSRQARPCNTLLPCGGGRSLLIDPCGKAAVKTPEETLRFDAWTVPLRPVLGGGSPRPGMVTVSGVPNHLEGVSFFALIAGEPSHHSESLCWGGTS